MDGSSVDAAAANQDHDASIHSRVNDHLNSMMMQANGQGNLWGAVQEKTT